ncbi:MAG: mevalonate kinase [Chloroflexota bacterium]|nr:MAG: mevalonate kinase [Chloroflexota bacterium]
MSVTTATAPGKIILFGEHAVVYGRPAIAAPVTQIRAEAVVADSSSAGIRLVAPDIGRDYRLTEARANDPFARSVRLVLEESGLSSPPDLRITVQSTIPIASGLGSGAAMAAAVIRALACHLELEQMATDERVSELTYQVEKLLHGTPSGIDNTVVAHEKPVYFVRQKPQNRIKTLTVARPIWLLVADTGVASSTKSVVGDVRRQWQAEPERFEQIFSACGRIADQARQAIEQGARPALGRLMTDNQSYLRQMTVSSAELDRLVSTAVSAGALGAKLSGAGRGGNMIALVTQGSEEVVGRALIAAGASSIQRSILG